MTIPELLVSLSPALWSAGGAVAGLLGGQFTLKSSRMAKLEEEVKSCRERDANFQVVAAGFRMMAGEMARELPDNQVLKMVGDLLNRKLGPLPAIDDLAELLNDVDQADRDHAARRDAAEGHE